MTVTSVADATTKFLLGMCAGMADSDVGTGEYSRVWTHICAIACVSGHGLGQVRPDFSVMCRDTLQDNFTLLTILFLNYVNYMFLFFFNFAERVYVLKILTDWKIIN